MGCGSSRAPEVEEWEAPVTKVRPVQVNMTYDDDDSDNETMTPTTPMKTKTTMKKTGGELRGVVTEYYTENDSDNDTLSAATPMKTKNNKKEETFFSENNLNREGERSHENDNGTAELSLCDIDVVDTTNNSENKLSELVLNSDSDDDSEMFSSDEEEDSDDEFSTEEELINNSLQTMLRLRSNSRSMSNDEADSDIFVQSNDSSIRENLKSLLSIKSFSTDSNDFQNEKENEIIKQSVKNMMNFGSGQAVSSPDGQESSFRRVKRNSKSPLKGMLSFKSLSDDCDDDVVKLDEDMLEISLRGMLSFRSTALTLRENAKKFRKALNEVSFKDTSRCKYTCTYVKHKMNKIISLNSALSKFANDNALSFLNPFLDKSDMTEVLRVNLRKLLLCILKTKVQHITVCGDDSKFAAEGLVAIFQLVADLSPDPSEIHKKSDEIMKKVNAYKLLLS